MEQFHDMEARLNRLEEQVAHVWRVGTVTGRDKDKGTARVEVPDLSGGFLSYDLPVLFQKTLKDQFYTMPDVGEQVVCIFAPTGAEQGFVIGAFYSDADQPPVADLDKTHITFKDGGIIEYDRKTGALLIDVPGDITLKGANIHLNP